MPRDGEKYHVFYASAGEMKHAEFEKAESAAAFLMNYDYTTPRSRFPTNDLDKLAPREFIVLKGTIESPIQIVGWRLR